MAVETFDSPSSSAYIWTAPSAQTITIQMDAPGGGGGGNNGGNGGNGGTIEVEYSASSGEEIDVYVGGAGGPGANSSGGSGGVGYDAGGSGGDAVFGTSAGGGGGGATAVLAGDDSIIATAGAGGGGSGGGDGSAAEGGGGGGGARGGLGGASGNNAGQDASGTGAGGDGGDASTGTGSPGQDGSTIHNQGTLVSSTDGGGASGGTAGSGGGGTAGSDGSVSITYTPDNYFSGNILDSDGQTRISGATVILIDTLSNSVTSTTTSNSVGTYSFNPDPKSYQVIADASNFVGENIPFLYRPWYDAGESENYWTSGISSNSGSRTKNASNMVVEVSGNSSNTADYSWATTQTLNLSNYSTLEIEWENTGGSNATSAFLVGGTQIDGYGANQATVELTGSFTQQTDSLDVSGITSNLYIRVHAVDTDGKNAVNSNITIYRIEAIE